MTVLHTKRRKSSSGRAIKTNSEHLKRMLRNIFRGITLFFSLSLLFSYLAVHINPRVFALPSLFGLAYPYILLFNIIIAIVWLMMLRKEALLPLIVILIGYNHLSNYIKVFKPRTSKENTFEVMSYNIRMFNYLEGSKNKNSKQKIIELIRTRKPDIICLQEFYEPTDAEARIEAFRKSIGSNYYSHVKKVGGRRGSFYGIATFSKYKIVGKGEIVHPNSSSLSVYTDVLIEKDTFRIYNNHLQSFRLRRMEHNLFQELTQSDDVETISEVKSLSLSLRKAFARRAGQAQAVKNRINKSPYPVIVAGDFNDTPVSYSYRKIRKGLNDAFVNSGYGAGFTYKGNYPPNRIDYVLYDNALQNTCFEILKVKYSDHYPVFAYFKKRY